MAEDLGDAPTGVRSLGGVDQLRLKCDHVDLSIVGEPGLEGELRVEVDDGDGDSLLRREGGTLVFDQRNQRWPHISEAALYVPLTACPPIHASHQRGDVQIERVSAPVQLEHGQGDVAIESGAGPVRLECKAGDVLVRDRNGPVHLQTVHGDVEIVRCRGPVSVDLTHGDVEIADCDGDIALQARSGDVAIRRPNAARVAVNTGSGDVSVDGGSVVTLQVRTGSGDIATSAHLLYHPGPPARPRAPDRHANGGQLDADLERVDEDLRRGDPPLGRELEGLAQLGARADGSGGPFHLETGSGDISAALPAGLPFRVEVIAGDGDVTSDVPLVSVGRPGPRGRTQRYVGVTTRAPVGDGERPTLRVRSDHGDIEIETVTDTLDGRRDEPGQQRPDDAEDVPPTRIADRDAEVRSVLDALERGEITVADAEALLDALRP